MVRIATWNINGLRARLPFVLHWLRERKPDLVALQELKLVEEQFPHEIFSDEGYEAFVLGQKSWNGVAVLSRRGGEILERGLPGQEALGARCLSVLVENLVVTSLYCPNGKSIDHPDFSQKLQWFDALYDHLYHRWDASESLVLAGDFNLCPTPLDSWNEAALQGQIFHTTQERKRFQQLLDWGLQDLFRLRFPETAAFSWWDYRGGAFHKKQGLRIDFLLGTGAVSAQLREVEIDREYRKKKDGHTASDHAPVIAELAE